MPNKSTKIMGVRLAKFEDVFGLLAFQEFSHFGYPIARRRVGQWNSGTTACFNSARATFLALKSDISAPISWMFVNPMNGRQS